MAGAFPGELSADQREFRHRRSPGARGDPSQTDPAVRDQTLGVQRHGGGGRGEGEGVGLPVTDLVVGGAATGGRRGNADPQDQLIGSQGVFEQRVVSRFDVQFTERQRPLASRADHVEYGVERDQGYGPVARIGGDAGVTGTQQRVGAVESLQSRTAAARIPLVAGELRSPAEVAASRALQQVPADRRHVAQLLGRRPPQGFRQRRIVTAYDRMVGDLGHSRSRTERQSVLTRADLGQLGETVNVDDGRRRLDAELHQVVQGRATGKDLGARLGGGQGIDGPGDAVGHYIGE